MKYSSKFDSKQRRKVTLVTNHVEITRLDRHRGWNVEWRQSRMKGGGVAKDGLMLLQKVLQRKGQILLMENIWPLVLSHTKHTVQMIIFMSLSLSHFPVLSNTHTHIFLPHFVAFHSFPSVYLFLPHCFFSSFFSQKMSDSLMHGSCREQCYFIFPWQQSLCFSGSHFSFGSNVLFFAKAEHIHVLNRRNYCKIPEIESPTSSLAIIIGDQREHKCPWLKRAVKGEMTGESWEKEARQEMSRRIKNIRMRIPFKVTSTGET